MKPSSCEIQLCVQIVIILGIYMFSLFNMFFFLHHLHNVGNTNLYYAIAIVSIVVQLIVNFI